MKPQHFLPLGIFLAIALAFGAAFYLNLNPRETPFAMEGKDVPAFDLPAAVEGGEGLGSVDLAGKVAIVNFFASWCAPCKAEHPVLMTLEKRAGVPVYGIAWKDRREALGAWLAADGNPFGRAGFDATGRVGIDWGISGVPETFVVDRAGKVVWRFQGALNDAVVDQVLIPLLRGLE
ncbi:MAG: DsbE family thiol:disulfide interchange protein [Sphingomonadales bacterium]